MRRKLQRLIVPLAVGYALLVACVAVFQRELTYFPEQRIVMSPSQVVLEGEEVLLSTADGLELAAWWFPQEESRGVVILCHGNGGNRSYALPLARRFFDRGFSVLAFDYRGYGGNPGSPTEDGLRSDARAALAFVTNAGFAPNEVLVHGHSLGSAVAIALAAEAEVGAVIIENAFSSLTDVASELYWWLPVRWLVRDTWTNYDRLEQVDEPLLIAYARGDQMVDAEHSQRLAERAGVVPFAFDGGHNASCLFTDDDQALSSFLNSYFPEESTQ